MNCKIEDYFSYRRVRETKYWLTRLSDRSYKDLMDNEALDSYFHPLYHSLTVGHSLTLAEISLRGS